MKKHYSVPTIAIDLACLFVVASTIGMYFVHEGASLSASRTILWMAIFKCLLIGAVFMGLLWSSRVAYAALATWLTLTTLLLMAILT